MSALHAQVLRVLSRDAGDSGRAELPYALRRPQRPSAPTMDALSLARHLAVSDVQVQHTLALAIMPPHLHIPLERWLPGSLTALFLPEGSRESQREPSQRAVQSSVSAGKWTEEALMPWGVSQNDCVHAGTHAEAGWVQDAAAHRGRAAADGQQRWRGPSVGRLSPRGQLHGLRAASDSCC